MANYENGLPFTREALRAFRADTADEATALNAFARRAALQYQNNFITPRLLAGVWRGIEFALLMGLGLVIFIAYVGSSSHLWLSYLILSVLGAAAGVIAIGLLDGYDLGVLKGSLAQFWRVAVAWAGTLSLLTAALFFVFNDGAHSRVWLGTWLVAGCGTLFVGRFVLRAKIRRWARNGRMERRAVVVGGGKGAEDLIRGLESQQDSDIRICGIFDDRDDARSPPIVAGYPKLGNIRELVEFARLARIDMLIVTLPLSAEQRLLSLLKHLWVLPLDIRLSAHSAQLRFRPRTYSFVGDIPLIDVFDQPLADWDRVGKRVFDVILASLALVALSPVMLVTALAIRLDSRGPVLFRQKRHGFNNQIVEIYKFRSLFHEMSDPLARQIVTRDDKRVTRVGRFIRKTSIDELPQLFNVLRGELSLVGPRPHAVHAISSRNETFVQIVDGYFGRHKVKPGITGWAQIKGWRGEIDSPEKLEKRFEHDLYYIENWSLLLDLYILAMTPISLLKSESAY
ncbi:undecaprenyl-phosphate glucose phosphotransferase [Aurantimonas aggregata]|uniref:Undecaprenyl-phosphate glucose phosphotransferase n=1 Tax=Aurantimonas aggregata TaxID=2047720 RepID=A0A6L9MGJ5_9HYPH|nr:undecaprenyl-phosphate glucose phosphotransferase [Aurantimonas aggregata]NDV86923.1 undecaprenyl-phosphate glucose phosphotransferase [Aurantimonas aggregata]